MGSKRRKARNRTAARARRVVVAQTPVAAETPASSHVVVAETPAPFHVVVAEPAPSPSHARADSPASIVGEDMATMLRTLAMVVTSAYDASDCAATYLRVFYRADRWAHNWACTKALVAARERVRRSPTTDGLRYYAHCLGVALALALPCDYACHVALERALAAYGWQQGAFVELPTCIDATRHDATLRLELERLCDNANAIASIV